MRLLVSALEHSANIHLKALKAHLPDCVEFDGIFSSELGEPIIDLQSLAVMGIVDAIKKLPFFYNLANEMTKRASKADKILLMDSSGFNLPLAKKIKKRYPNKEIYYYILPQAWAWRRGRIKVLESYCDHLLSILPFEKDYYSKTAPINYVGHPLLDEISLFKERPPTPKATKTIAYLAGSRRGEITKLMPLFHQLRQNLEPHRALIVIPPYFSNEQIESLYGNLSNFEIRHDTHATLFESDFAFICSGTATLESALIGTPFILTYKAKFIDYILVKSLVDIEYAGLANLFSLDFQGRIMHPEFIQKDLTIDNLIKSYKNYDYKRFFKDVIALRAYLKQGSSQEVANILLDLSKSNT